MLEFFRGWKRKAGSVTLILACMSALGLVRSIYFKDKIKFYTDSTIYACGSTSHWITVDYQYIPSNPEAFEVFRRLHSFRVISNPLVEETPANTQPVEPPAETSGTLGFTLACGGPDAPERTPSQWRRVGIEFYWTPSWTSEGYTLEVSYLSIIIPFTLISTWLLLSKPGTKIEPKIVGDRKP